MRDVRVRPGDNRRTVTLQLQKQEEELTVGRDAQSAALDSRGAAFSTVLTREQIEALPDDPDEMEAVLKAMSPPGSTIRIDGFTGGKLPPKSQIRSIRLPRMDQFAAQNHGGMMGEHFIDIMTQPGAGPASRQRRLQLPGRRVQRAQRVDPGKGRRAAAAGRHVAVGHDPAEQDLVLDVVRRARRSTSRPTCWPCCPAARRAPRRCGSRRMRMNFNGRLDHALNKDHSMRVSFDRNGSATAQPGRRRLQPARARVSQANPTTNMLRLSENGPLGRRFFTESRLQVRWADTEMASAIEAPTIRVNDAFTSGGAQMRGGRSDVSFEVASDLDYVRGNHSWRTGLLFEGGRYKSDDTSNYLGTYTFASLADYEAGRPTNYTRRIGDPNVSYSHMQAAAYVQDDWRIARSLLLSAGVRYGMQTHVGDAWNLSPRVSAAWSPLRNGNADDSAGATAISTTGSRATSTSRRCSSTGSGSAS